MRLLLASYLNVSEISAIFLICCCFSFSLCESCVSLLLESYLHVSERSEIFLICCCFAVFFTESWVSLLLESYLNLNISDIDIFLISSCFAFFLCESCVSLLLASYLSISDISEIFWYAFVLPSFSVRAAWVYCLKATWINISSFFDMLLFCLLSLWKLREFTAWKLLEYFWHKWDIFDNHLLCLLSL